jgi:hypothetical protein
MYSSEPKKAKTNATILSHQFPFSIFHDIARKGEIIAEEIIMVA